MFISETVQERADVAHRFSASCEAAIKVQNWNRASLHLSLAKNAFNECDKIVTRMEKIKPGGLGEVVAIFNRNVCNAAHEAVANAANLLHVATLGR